MTPENVKMVLDWLLARAVEPSTWAGLAVAAVVHFGLPVQDSGVVTQVLVDAAAAAAVILKEKGVA